MFLPRERALELVSAPATRRPELAVFEWVDPKMDSDRLLWTPAPNLGFSGNLNAESVIVVERVL